MDLGPPMYRWGGSRRPRPSGVFTQDRRISVSVEWRSTVTSMGGLKEDGVREYHWGWRFWRARVLLRTWRWRQPSTSGSLRATVSIRVDFEEVSLVGRRPWELHPRSVSRGHFTPSWRWGDVLTKRWKYWKSVIIITCLYEKSNWTSKDERPRTGL